MPANPFTKSPLFRLAPAKMRSAARGRFQKSVAGKLRTEINRLGSRASGREVQKVIQRHARRLGSQEVLREILGRDTYRMAREVERYAKSNSLNRKLLNDILGALGPAGKLIRAVISPAAGKSLLGNELKTAADLLRSYGRLVVEPGKSDQAETMAEHLRGMGYTVIPPGERRPNGTKSPNTSDEEIQTGRKRKTVQIEGAGRTQFPANHPIVTGQMAMTPNSTNVHSFGYDSENRFLYVRFLDDLGKGRRAGPGPLYRYAAVTPREFLGLYRTRNRGDGHGGDSTPGTWLWTHLRIRGTLTGHRKDYELVGIVRDYTPRKATLLPEGEAYIRRTVRTLEGKTVRSALDSRLVRPLAPTRVRRG